MQFIMLNHQSGISYAVVMDIQKNPGDQVPSVIGRFRPDVYADGNGAVIVAEVKTHSTLNSMHTENQLRAFIAHLERCRAGVFILAAGGSAADHAKTILYFTYKKLMPAKTTMSVFDSYDWWGLVADSGASKWRLI